MASSVAQLQAALDAKQAELEAEQEANALASAKALLQVAQALNLRRPPGQGSCSKTLTW